MRKIFLNVWFLGDSCHINLLQPHHIHDLFLHVSVSNNPQTFLVIFPNKLLSLNTKPQEKRGDLDIFFIYYFSRDSSKTIRPKVDFQF